MILSVAIRLAIDSLLWYLSDVPSSPLFPNGMEREEEEEEEEEGAAINDPFNVAT